jgi:hypothetical protein
MVWANALSVMHHDERRLAGYAGGNIVQVPRVLLILPASLATMPPSLLLREEGCKSPHTWCKVLLRVPAQRPL